MERLSSDGLAPSVLVTGVGGAAGIAVARALSGTDALLHLADCDPLATGMHLAPPEQRVVLPKGGDRSFVDEVLGVCAERAVDVLIPTVDEELLPVAAAAGRFEAIGVRVMAADHHTLATCLDKHLLISAVRSSVPCPASEPFSESFDPAGWRFPVVVKPRVGRGGNGFTLVASADALGSIPRDQGLLVQEYLPGDEYSVDVLIDSRGRTVASVPRLRIRVDSGVATVTRTVHDPQVEEAAARAADCVGLRGVANVQFRRGEDGEAKLLEINPRFPGTLAVTIASGVNLVGLALRDCLGEELPADAGDFTETGMVRMLGDMVVSADEIRLLESGSAPVAV